MLALVSLTLILMPDDGIGLAVDDLPEYLAALLQPAPGAVSSVTPFRDLWTRPDDFRGKLVGVRGHVAREFSTPASGELPARTEVWLVQEDGNLICAVVPRRDAAAFVGRSVEIRGTSLGLIRYRAGDVIRLAPLVVGPGPPRVLPGRSGSHSRSIWDGTSWLIASAAIVVVLAFLARAFARRRSRPRVEPGPSVEFHS
jgi:hypothetical protein